ncbi:MAG: hypothetical protein HOP29_03500, partial [Phycisphaerales bacterium]|nr:hypothetical protein [Phycisphaerales bacterium]
APTATHQDWDYDDENSDPAKWNNVKKYTDATGIETLFFYEANGIDKTALTRVTLPPAEPGGSTSDILLTYYFSGGLLESVTDANGVRTEYDYDGYGQVNRETEGSSSGDRVRIDHSFDSLGRPILSTRRGLCGTGAPSAPSGSGTDGLVWNSNNLLLEASCGMPAIFAPSCDVQGSPEFLTFGSIGSTFDAAGASDYDTVGRLKHAELEMLDLGSGENPSVILDVTYDARGRIRTRSRKSTEPYWGLATPPSQVTEAFTYTYDDANGQYTRQDGINQGSGYPAGVRLTTSTDVQGRVTSVVAQYYSSGVYSNLYSAAYTYQTDPNRDLIDKVTYGNGTEIHYVYDELGRATAIQHLNPAAQPGPIAILQFGYTFDERGSLVTVSETGIDGSGHLAYTYDNRGRLTREVRTLSNPYDLTYSYDAGGNRWTKDDAVNHRQTVYDYDLNNNRLNGYDILDTTAAVVVERVVYEYHHDGDAAGNVRRVQRKVSNPPSSNPDTFNVFATEFHYNHAAQVQVMSHREWTEGPSGPGPVTTAAIREFRGGGRARYMMRDRNAATLSPDYASAVWTAYDGDEPTRDYSLQVSGSQYYPVPADRYQLGIAQAKPASSSPNLNVNYFHTDHVGSTRAMTNSPESGPAFASPRIVYTAFGEPVFASGALDIRYQYVGRHGYESFAFTPYLHVGYRWYDPSTGRFLQRDPIGVRGGLNVYAYVELSPVDGLDPSGLDRWYYREPGHSWVYFRNADGSYTRYALGPDSSNWFYGPGQVQKQTVPSLPQLPWYSSWWRFYEYETTPEQDGTDRAAIERERSNPPTYSFPGIFGYNCENWALKWATKYNESPQVFPIPG